jgi:hypothetical protein
VLAGLGFILFVDILMVSVQRLFQSSPTLFLRV